MAAHGGERAVKGRLGKGLLLFGEHAGRERYVGLAAILVGTTLVAMFPATYLSSGDVLNIVLLVGLYGTLMFASSYVEEEHLFWYWIASGWLALLALRR